MADSSYFKKALALIANNVPRIYEVERPVGIGEQLAAILSIILP